MSDASQPVAAVVEPSRLARGRATAFVVTWISYAAYYLGRKNLSVARASILRELGPGALRGVETAYLAAYAVGQYANGLLGDRIGARRLVGGGMLLSAAACIAFGLAPAGIALLLAFLVNGLAQSTGWPGNVKAMAEWTTRSDRGAIMGVWSTCYQVGGIAATAVAAQLLAVFGGWRAAFIGPGILMALVGLLVLALLRKGPSLDAQSADGEPVDAAAETHLRAEAQRAVFRNPTVWLYGTSYFGIKLIRYSLLFWLPYYLATVLHYPDAQAAYLSVAFEVGGIGGAIGLGWISDRARGVRRSVFALLSLVGLAGALLLYAKLGATGVAANAGLMALVGALLFGPDTLLSGAAAQDAGGPRAAAITAGMVNGIGSVGAILQEFVTRTVSDRWGWGTLFQVFVGLALLSALALVPTVVGKDRATADGGAPAPR